MTTSHAVFCPCCGQANPQRSFLTKIPVGGEVCTFRVTTCPECDHSWLATSSTQHKKIEEIYDHDYSGHRVDPVFERKCLEALKEDIAPLVPPPASLLDVGCGNGSFVLAAQEMGYSALGIDIARAGVEIAVRRGANARCIDFETHEFGIKFDIISMWDVVEHLHDPIIFFRRAHKLLKPGGVLVIKTPSIGKACLQIVRHLDGTAPALLHAPNHVQYWTRHSMAVVLTRSGFVDPIFWPSRSFRGSPASTSFQRKLIRKAKNFIQKYSGNSNLFLAARTDR